jgi:hypothetical protein
MYKRICKWLCVRMYEPVLMCVHFLCFDGDAYTYAKRVYVCVCVCMHACLYVNINTLMPPCTCVVRACEHAHRQGLIRHAGKHVWQLLLLLGGGGGGRAAASSSASSSSSSSSSASSSSSSSSASSSSSSYSSSWCHL